MPKILFISNGHGEDLNGSLIAQQMRKIKPDMNLLALPIVGKGDAYGKIKIEMACPTQGMPSGGIFYLNPLNLLKDLSSGLFELTIKQISALNKYSQLCDLVVAVGDVIPILFAHLSGCNFVAFIVSTSSYYEGTLKLPWLTKQLLESPRCLQIFTRDQFTAIDLQQQGLSKAVFAGYPIMDALNPTGKDLGLSANLSTIALLPGSRLPEALKNLALQLRVCEQLCLSGKTNFNFSAALVPSIQDSHLQIIAEKQDWQYLESGKIVKKIGLQDIVIQSHRDAFADILTQSDVVLGMAGTAVEQAVGLGKPVIQIPGEGPQFTYRFAEAQMRLLGISVKTLEKNSSPLIIARRAAGEILNTLQDDDYQQKCLENGRQRVGGRGGSYQIARQTLQLLEETMASG